MSNQNNANPYEAVLADLQARKQEIEVAIAAISRIAGLGDTPPPTVSSVPGAQSLETEIRSDSFFNMTTQAAIKKCLRMSKKPLSAAEITRRLEKGGIIHDAKNFYNSVYTALRRLKRSHEAVQLENKDWGLASWYPNKPRQNKKGSTGADGDAGTDAETGEANGGDQEETSQEKSLKAL